MLWILKLIYILILSCAYGIKKPPIFWRFFIQKFCITAGLKLVWLRRLFQLNAYEWY